MDHQKGFFKYFTTLAICLLLFSSCRPDDIETTSINTETISLENIRILNITENEQVITITVPYETDMKSLVPFFKLKGEGEIIPNLGKAFDFSKPVQFTIVHPSGGKNIVTINVKQDEQPTPVINQFSANEVEAGTKLTVIGKNFGKFTLGLTVNLLNEKQESILLSHELIDDKGIELTIPDTLRPQNYKVQVKVNKKTVVSTETLKVTYPTPLITSTEGRFFTQNDSLLLNGLYLNNAQYEFKVYFQNQNELKESKVSNKRFEKNKLQTQVPASLSAGKYDIVIENISTQKKSKKLSEVIEVFDALRPFVRGLKQVKNEASETELRFSTINFEKEPIRFYQVQLTNQNTQYVLNGIFNATEKQLQVILPSAIQKGTYSIAFSLSNPAQNYNYRFQINTKLEVN